MTEIEGRLRSQQQLLGKIVGVMFPALFGYRTPSELCRVRGWDKNWPSRLLKALPKRSWLKRLRRLGEVTVVIVDEPRQDRFYLLCLETTLSSPQLIRSWRRRHWIECVCRVLKHLLATEACQVHSEEVWSTRFDSLALFMAHWR